ncbi:MAG: hypothetical protein PHC50_10100 [Candidatus Cloacimonetes bacterium]|nr:hypothetical protein [Candidatus Cloacimonadota bacterium]
MKRLSLLIVLVLGLLSAAGAISIYEIQYTNNPGSDNTYPSQYAGKTVVTEGIVTATNYKGGGFFVSEPVAGAYSGILVLDRSPQVKVGDRIRLSATVRESFGMTTLQDVQELRILERTHPLPNPVILTTSQLGRSLEAEAYEGVYVRILGVSAQGKSNRSRFAVSDGTGHCSVQLGTFAKAKPEAAPKGSSFASITGVVSFSFGEFSLNPVNASDIINAQPVSVQGRSWGKIKSIYK